MDAESSLVAVVTDPGIQVGQPVLLGQFLFGASLADFLPSKIDLPVLALCQS